MCFRKIAKGILLVSLCILLCACAKGKTPPKDRLPSRPYGYTLTQEQRQNYQSAVCYLIKRDGEDTYRIQYSDCGVTLSDGTLYTDYNGMAVEITSKAQESYFPALNLHGSSGSQGFTGFVALVDRQYNVARCFYLLNHAGSQGEPALATIQPVDAVAEEELLSGEYTGLPDFSEYKEVFFHVGTYYHLAYAEDGKPLPISQWEPTSMFIGYSFVFAQDIELRYVPLVGGDYYLLYEITDTQGNTYCSDLIPYQTEPTAAEEKKQPDITVKWKKGERQQLLWESDGVELYLSVEKDAYGNSEYALKAKNNTQNPISCIARDGLANGKVVCTTGRDLTVAPGKFVANEYAFSFGIADGSPELERIDTLQFSVEIQDRNSGKYILEPQTILVDMSQAWPVSRKHTEYFKLNEPALDALAQEQVLLETEYLRLTLIGAGQFEPSSIQNLRVTLKAENLSDRSQSLCLDGVVVNGMFMRTDINITLPAGGYDLCV